MIHKKKKLRLNRKQVSASFETTATSKTKEEQNKTQT